MEKKGKIIAYAVLIVLVASSMGVINFTKAKDYLPLSIQKEEGLKFIIESDYLAKGGLDENLRSYLDSEHDSVGLINWLTQHVYGVAILETPVVLNGETIAELVEEMRDMNEQIVDGPEGQYFSSPLFSERLITKVAANRYGLLDLIAIENEAEQSVKIYCDAYKKYLDDDDRLQEPRASPLSSEEDTILMWCNRQPDQLLHRDGLKYVLSLPDLPIETDYRESNCVESHQCNLQGTCTGSEEFGCYNFNTEAECVANGCTFVASVCSTQYLPVCDPINAKTYENACEACSDGVSFYTQGECPAYEYVTGLLGGDEICYITIGQKMQTLELSKIQLEIHEKSGDVFIALGSKGIQEVMRVDGKYQFAQYGYEIEHKDALSLNDWNGEPGYAVISNSDGVVDASNGDVEQTSNLGDLWYGLKTGKVATAPLFWVNAVHTILIIGLLVGLIVTVVM